MKRVAMPLLVGLAAEFLYRTVMRILINIVALCLLITGVLKQW